MRERLRHARRTMPVLIVDFSRRRADRRLHERGRRYIHINHRGDVEPCIFVHFAADNIHEKPLAECLCSEFSANCARACRTTRTTCGRA